MQDAEERIGDQAEHADGQDAGDNLVGRAEAHGLQDHVADPRFCIHKLGHDQVGPGPADDDAQRIDHVGQRGRDQDAGEDLPARRAERVGDVEQLFGDAGRDVGDQQGEMIMATFSLSSNPIHTISKGIKAEAGR